MSWDAEALVRHIQESELSMAKAMSEIMALRGPDADLEKENERLRGRLLKFGQRIRRMEEGEL